MLSRTPIACAFEISRSFLFCFCLSTDGAIDNSVRAVPYESGIMLRPGVRCISGPNFNYPGCT
ncbi:hypothetical protein AGR1C_pTi0038 [Agrobacterium fabacearum TT111]|nr:hypothetical protein AGR1C_pTi0038 [Agrobacterium fabacearum TT111]